MFNLVNHSDTIACVLFELLVNLELIFVSFQNSRSRFHKFQFCPIFKVLLAVRISRDSLFIISHEVPFVKNFFETFLKFFSRAEALEKPSKAVAMRFSAAVRVALAPDSLTIIPPENHFVNIFFQIFDNFFGSRKGGRYIVLSSGDGRMIAYAGYFCQYRSITFGDTHNPRNKKRAF